jgi:hypothetical protein
MNIEVAGEWWHYVIAACLIGMIVFWFVLVTRLFRHLEKHHPAKYDSMGRPSLFLRNNIATNWSTLKFLVAREHRTLNDSRLSRLADFMLLYLCTYLLCFFSVIAWANWLQRHAS